MNWNPIRAARARRVERRLLEEVGPAIFGARPDFVIAPPVGTRLHLIQRVRRANLWITHCDVKEHHGVRPWAEIQVEVPFFIVGARRQRLLEAARTTVQTCAPAGLRWSCEVSNRWWIDGLYWIFTFLVLLVT